MLAHVLKQSPVNRTLGPLTLYPLTKLLKTTFFSLQVLDQALHHEFSEPGGTRGLEFFAELLVGCGGFRCVQ